MMQRKMKLTYNQLKSRQADPLQVKIHRSKIAIRNWYETNNGRVYVGFSGGKDSTVLLHIARSIYPDIPAVFCDTGLEYPEIKEFVKQHDNITIRPKMTFKQVIDKYGYPIISKIQSMAISRYRNTKRQDQRDYRLNGRICSKTGKKLVAGVISKKYHYLIDAPFKISERCCDILKKNPFKIYSKETGRVPMTGEMASDGMSRRLQYLKKGCNSYITKKSTPLGHWLDKDIWQYLKDNDLPYCSVYDTGVDRTGCIFCMYGIYQEGTPNRFQRMKTSHPKLYAYCMEKLKIRDVLEYMKIPFT